MAHMAAERSSQWTSNPKLVLAIHSENRLLSPLGNIPPALVQCPTIDQPPGQRLVFPSGHHPKAPADIFCEALLRAVVRMGTAMFHRKSVSVRDR